MVVERLPENAGAPSGELLSDMIREAKQEVCRLQAIAEQQTLDILRELVSNIDVEGESAPPNFNPQAFFWFNGGHFSNGGKFQLNIAGYDHRHVIDGPGSSVRVGSDEQGAEPCNGFCAVFVDAVSRKITPEMVENLTHLLFCTQ